MYTTWPSAGSPAFKGLESLVIYIYIQENRMVRQLTRPCLSLTVKCTYKVLKLPFEVWSATRRPGEYDEESLHLE